MKEKKKISIKEVIFAVVSIILTCAYPCAFLYLQNVDEAGIDGIIIPLGIYLLVAFIILLIAMMFFWDISRSAAFSCIFMIFFMNFILIQNIINIVFSFVTYFHLTIVVLAIVIVVAVFMKKKKTDGLLWCEVLTFVFAALITVNILSAIPKIISGGEEIKDIEVEHYAQNTDFKGNVYYIILDEYSGQDNLDYYYDFDNSDIKNYLEDKGFSWSDDSYNYESISTFEIIPNILNLDYVSEIDAAPNKNLQYTKNPVLYRFFEDMGYEINMINHENFLVSENRKVLSHSNFSFAEVESVSLSKNIINQGYVSILYNTMLESLSNQSVENSGGDLDDAMECTKNAYKEVGSKPTFTICYLQCPHTAFVYKENGEKNDNVGDLENWGDKELYLGQLKYTNSFIKETVDNILNNDPNSIIVFQADHGARYSYHCMMDYKKSEYDAPLETEKMQNVLNAVYVGEDVDINIEGLSCINTWRTILNLVYGTDYKMLDEPKHYIYKWRYRNALN